MRNLGLLAAIPFALGCAQQSALRAPSLPTDAPLHVRLLQPTAGALNYQLSEPAYVAIFAVTRGHGISMIFPYYDSQADHQSRRGLNQETVHGGTGAWGYSATEGNEHRALFGYADAYYVIASKFPLPLEGMMQSPWVLRSLVGADVFRAGKLTDTWAALQSILVQGMPVDAWSADVYLNWRNPFLLVGAVPDRLFSYCGDRPSFINVSMLSYNYCGRNLANVSNASPVPVAPGGTRAPPSEPKDRNPQSPLNPPRVGEDDAIARASRTASRNPSDAGARGEPRPSEPSRPSEARPQQPPSRDEATRPAPQPIPNPNR